MSEVISFRVNHNNPRETQALRILENWCAQGYSVRQVVIEALLRLDHSDLSSEVCQNNQELSTLSEQINQVLEILKVVKADPREEQQLNSESEILSDSFLASMKLFAKPGINFEK
jgi:hypothetical protein